jgi:hypothetical protein
MNDDRTKPTGEDTGKSSPEYPEGTGDYSEESEEGAGGRREFWKSLGFETFRDYIDHLNEMQDRYAPLPRMARPPAPDVSELDASKPEPPRSSYMRRRQVNVKLRDHEADALERAADVYGLRPATLARVLVNRGVEAILERRG